MKIKHDGMQLVELIVLFIKLKTGVIQKRVRAEKQGAQNNGRWENVVREVGGCGARVILEVHRHHIRKRYPRENKNKFIKW